MPLGADPVIAVIPPEAPAAPMLERPGAVPGITVEAALPGAAPAGRDPLALIEHYESRGQNIPNYRYDPQHTASGYWQITDTNWRNLAPGLGIDLQHFPTAMSAPKDVQRRVAAELYRRHGFAPWAPFNPALAKAAGWHGGLGGDAVTQAGKWHVAPQAIADAQKQPDTDVVWMSPDDYIASMAGSTPSATPDAKRGEALRKRLEAGEPLMDLPEIEGSLDASGKFAITGYDGLARAQFAKAQGVDLMPVAVKGMRPGHVPDMLVDMHGKLRPFNFQPVTAGRIPSAGQQAAASHAHEMGAMERIGRGVKEAGRLLGEAAEDTAGTLASVPLGALRPVVGAAQLAAHGAEAVGIPGAGAAAAATDAGARGLENAIGALPGGSLGASVGDVGAAFALPGNFLGAVPRILRPAAAAAYGAATGAIQPAPAASPEDYWAQKAEQAATGAVAGGGLQIGGEVANAARTLARRVVTPATLTGAASRLLGENTNRLTPQVLQGVRKRTGATFQRIENAHDLSLSNELVRDLGTIDRDAQTLGAEGAPIQKVVDLVLSRARANGVLPGGSAAALWHSGAPIDRLTKSLNPNVRILAQRLKSALRDAYGRQLPPDAAAEYSAARHTWRDLRIVERALKPGQHRLAPNTFVAQVGRRFPEQASHVGGPPVLELARAAGETFAPSHGRYGAGALGVAGAILGEHVAGMPGGAFGALTGTLTGHLVLDRLAGLRLARGNALAAFRPPSAPAMRNALATMGRYAAPAGA